MPTSLLSGKYGVCNLRRAVPILTGDGIQSSVVIGILDTQLAGDVLYSEDSSMAEHAGIQIKINQNQCSMGIAFHWPPRNWKKVPMEQ